MPCISVQMFIIPKLQNISWRIFISKIFSLCIDHTPNCCSVSLLAFSYFFPDWSLREHLSRALPTERIFSLLRSIRSERLVHDYSAELILATLEIITKWLQVSVIQVECNRQTLRLKSDMCPGTWFRATERLVRLLSR